MNNPPSSEPAIESRPPFQWRLWLLLLALNLVASVIILPYAAALQPAETGSGTSWLGLVLSQLLSALILNGALAAIGMLAGRSIGLGAPLLGDWLCGVPVAPRLKRVGLIAIAVGLAAGVALLALIALSGPLLAAEFEALGVDTDVPTPAPWKGFLASLSAGISEETLLRLFLLTVLAWLGTRLLRRDRPGLAVLWTANVISALTFGLLHLPLASSLGLITPLMVVRTLLLNGLVGLVFGWLYWRHGLLAAMIGHASTDLVLHVIVPAIALLAG